MENFSRPATARLRPAYMESLFRYTSPYPALPSTITATAFPSELCATPTSSRCSSNSWKSLSTLDTRCSSPPCTPPQTPVSTDDERDDGISLRSIRLHLSPRFKKFRGLLRRRTYTQVQETNPSDLSDWSPSRSSQTIPRRPTTADLPKLQTSITTPLPPRKNSFIFVHRPLPALPTPKAEELPCQRCYYFFARHCNGYVMGGSHGDACESCAKAGFFGSP